MKQLGSALVLTFLLILAFGSQAGAADRTVTVANNSGSAVNVAILWSGGSLPPFKLEPGTLAAQVFPTSIDSAKVTVTGKCREKSATFDPQRIDRVTIDCKGGTYTVTLGETKPAP